MSQEDAHTTILDVSDSGKESGVGLFGVFDGHGGKAVAKFVAKHMVLFQCCPATLHLTSRYGSSQATLFLLNM